MLSKDSDKKLFLIDAYALIFRAYYAFIKNPRINSKGINTSAVFGFVNAVLEIIRIEKPTHLAVVFDPPGGSFRNQVYPEYKANRDATPEDIILSIPLIHKVLEGLKIPTRMEMGYEADDLIGFLAKKAEAEGYDVYMMTPDKDFGQLVSDRCRMYRPGRGKNPPNIWGPEEVCERFGLNNTEQVIDYLGLMGDASDNIPGVPGVGAKTASKLLCEFGTIEGLYKNTAKLKGKLREKVEANYDKAILSKELATIVLDIPAEINIEGMLRQSQDDEVLREILEELEFRSLINKLLPEGRKTSIQPAVSIPKAERPLKLEEGQLSMFNTVVSDSAKSDETAQVTETLEVISEETSIISRELSGNYSVAVSDEEVDELVRSLESVGSFGFHTITSGFDAMRDNLLGFAFSIKKGEAVYVPLEKDTLSKFKSILENKETEIVAVNFKFAAKVLSMHGVKLSYNVFDCMVAHYLIDPDSNHRLERMAEVFLGYSAMSLEGILGRGKSRRSFEEVDSQIVSDYACEAADLVIQLASVFRKEIESLGISSLMNDVEFPLIGVLIDMELAGVMIDTSMLEKYSVSLTDQITTLKTNIIKEAGVEFNVDSPKQLGELLFETLVITEKAKKTKTGQYQTGEDVLKKLVDLHPIISLVLEYRKLKKLLSTYVDPLPKLVHEKTGRLHTSYMQTVASTGRLSSKDPNLQNIPIRTDAGREIRKAFIPADKNHVLLAADYSQVELRVAAAMSNDPGLCEAFREGQDIHSATASRVFGVKLEDVDRTQRSQAKAVNFGILYGQGAFGLAEELGIKRAEAKEIIARYNEQFNTLGDFTKKCIEKAREVEYSETILGRRRKLPDINSTNGMVKAFAERNAVNAPIQGSAADIIKVAMVNLARELQSGEWKSRMIMQVHDELVLDVPIDELEALKPLVKKCMEEAVKLSVPLEVDMSSGRDWLEAH